ncbi:MAG: ATP-binding protein [Methanobrevibacter sp.]|jgi:hypothetical protein|nr:ATP-binding protein [Candidatus Methanoflexus mossambicus]
MKKLPKGMADFINIRENDYIYVDKTEYIYKMFAPGEKYFLSRPRRFGKSLLVSTLKQLFKGNKKLFEGLYIYDKWNWDETYPVIHLDFGTRSKDSPEILTQSINIFLNNTAEDYQVKIMDNKLLPDRFEDLIKKIAKKTGKKLVILIDEYDKAITDNLSDPDIADANRKILSKFYEVMKGMDEYIHFIFITGVSKFPKTSIFSKLNNLTDLTLNSKYSAICGYTQEDLEYHFHEHIQELANSFNSNYNKIMSLIQLWYNGYSWDGKIKIYNPYSTLLLLFDHDFSNNWFTTGTPRFLIDLLKEKNNLEPILKPIKVDKSEFDEFEPLEIKQLPLLFQTGYLTITNIEIDDSFQREYTLEVPNQEVKKSLLNNLLNIYSQMTYMAVKKTAKTVLEQFQNKDTQGLNRSIEKVLSQIPYDIHIKHEDYYNSIFLLWLKTLGFNIIGEIQTNIGRLDALLQYNNQNIVIECKYTKEDDENKLDKCLDEKIKEGFKQINDKNYDLPFNPETTTQLVIAFNRKKVKCQFKN